MPAGRRDAPPALHGRDFTIKTDRGRLVIEVPDDIDEAQLATEFGIINDSQFKPRKRRVTVQKPGDLPEANNQGHRPLADDTEYKFNTTVEVAESLRLGTRSALLAEQPQEDFLRYTGTGSAVESREEPVGFFRIGIEAPNGAVFDLVGGDGDDFTAGFIFIREAADLGTIDNYQEPFIQSARFEQFSNPLTFTGTPDEIAISDCRFNNVGDGVTCIELAAGLTADVVTINNNSFTDFGANPTMLTVDNSATVEERGVYQGNTHDGTIAAADILDGVTPQTIGWAIQINPPLRDSRGVVSYTKSGSTATSFTAQDTFTRITGATAASANIERFEEAADNQYRYLGTTDRTVTVTAVVSTGGNNVTAGIGIAKNGTVVSGSEMQYENPGGTDSRTATTAATLDMTENDTMGVFLKNVDGTGDIRVDFMNVEGAD